MNDHRWSVGLQRVALVCTFLLPAANSRAENREHVLVGVAKVNLTPTTPVVLAGYGGRSKEYEGIDTKLWARALVIGDTAPVAIVAIDNCGVPRHVTERLAKRLSKHGLSRDHLIVAATHTHNAPTLTDYAPILWQGRTTPQQDKLTQEYTTLAIARMEQAVVTALANRQRMALEWVQGRVIFGGNRRVMNDGRWGGFGFQRAGPVDHSLPILAARDANGTVRAVWANYACHCTTVGSRNFVGGDWAGFANTWIEKEFPKAVSLMTIGCGADIGPQPSGNLQIAERHGKSVAGEVKKRLAGKTTRLTGTPTVATSRIKLPLAKPKPREYWESQLRTRGFGYQLARSMIQRLDKEGSLPSEVDYPISVWKFGNDLAMVFLAGEVVVDYSVRLKHELDWERLWITAWANEMPGYIPSRRVLVEGGYEAEFSQVYYGQPGPYEKQIEDVLVGAVRELVGKQFATTANKPAAPFHEIPSAEPIAFDRLSKWIASQKTSVEATVEAKIRRCLPVAGPAIGRVTRNGEKTEWHNFAGDFVRRSFIRQETRGAELRWTSPVIADDRQAPLVLCFCGGLGWESEPKTDGFALAIGDVEKLEFDVTRKPTRWVSNDHAVELLYLPTWTSDVDSGGFFFMTWNKPRLPEDGRLVVSVRSLGQGSKRWFAIDTKQNIPARLKKLITVFKRGNSR